MAASQALTKRVAITKANAQMMAAVITASVVTVFCLVASHALLGQNSYLSKVNAAKQKAHNQLVSNIQAYDKLAVSYQNFVSQPSNVIGGPSTGTGVNSGDNAQIILDALPSNYDFPRLTSTVEKILTDRGFTVSGITGTDDQLNQQNNISSPNPQPVPMPFSFTVTNSSYGQLGVLVQALQQSIRPISIDSIDLNGEASNMTMTVNAHTYYQPGKNLSITEAVVK